MLPEALNTNEPDLHNSTKTMHMCNLVSRLKLESQRNGGPCMDEFPAGGC